MISNLCRRMFNKIWSVQRFWGGPHFGIWNLVLSKIFLYPRHVKRMIPTLPMVGWVTQAKNGSRRDAARTEFSCVPLHWGNLRVSLSLCDSTYFENLKENVGSTSATGFDVACSQPSKAINVRQNNHKPTIFGWFTAPIYGGFGNSLLLFYPHYRIVPLQTLGTAP